MSELPACFVVGIDPGVNGAIAVLDQAGKLVWVRDIPNVKVEKQSSKKIWKSSEGVERVVTARYRTELDFAELANLFGELVDLPGVKKVALERVTAMPRDSSVGAFTFGGSFWALRQALADHHLTYQLISPKRWQAELLGSPEKDRTKLRDQYLAKARTLFGDEYLTRKTDADRAAALLLAECLRRNALHAYRLPDLLPPGEL